MQAIFAPKCIFLVLVLAFASLCFTTNAQPVTLASVIASASSSLTQVETPEGATVTLSWGLRSNQSSAGMRMSLIARQYISESNKCPQTLEEKTAGYTQIIIPSIETRDLTTSFTLSKVYFKHLCFYFQQNLDPTDEFLLFTHGSTQSRMTMQQDFCTLCSQSQNSLGCDPVGRKCICKPGVAYANEQYCLDQAAIKQKFPSLSCSWQETDILFTTATACACSGYWSGTTCQTCSLETCAGWKKSERCFTCATAQGSDLPNLPNEDCTACKCTSPYYRGPTCSCRAAIFDIVGDFKYPNGNYTAFELTTDSTSSSIANQLEDNISAQLYLIQLRLALALDLEIPVYNIEVVHFWGNSLRLAVSPWCISKFYSISIPKNVNPTRAQAATGSATSINLPNEPNLLPLDVLEAAKLPADQLAFLQRDLGHLEHQVALSKINTLKQLYQLRYGRSVTEPLTDEEREQYMEKTTMKAQSSSSSSIFQTLDNASNVPFQDLFQRVKTLQSAETSHIRSLLEHHIDPATPSTTFTTKQIYFPNCGTDEICPQLSADPYAKEESDNSTMIIIIVIVVVVILLGIGVASCLYCNSKKICCFKSIAEYNERKKRKENERAARDGSGSNTHSGSNDTNSDTGSNSNHPKGDSASGNFNQSAYHNSSTSAINQDQHRSSGSNSIPAAGQVRRVSTVQSPTSPRPNPSASRRSSAATRNVEMTPASPRDSSRRISRGVKSRGPSRTVPGGLRASNAAAIAASAGAHPSSPITDSPSGSQNNEECDLPLPAGWESHISQDGKLYFVNTQTLTSQWTHPSLPSDEKERSADDLDYLPE